MSEEDLDFGALTKKARERDEKSKAEAKEYTDRRRRAIEHNFEIGDEVFMQQPRTNKWTTRFNEEKVRIVGINGSMITITTNEGQEITRDASRFKKSKHSMQQHKAEETLLKTREGESRMRKRRISKPVIRFNEHRPETWVHKVEIGEEMI